VPRSLAAVRVQWPVNFDEVIRAELDGELPLDVAAIVAEAETAAYTRGCVAALEAVAVEHARLELLGENWRERAVEQYQALRQRRRAEIDDAAEAERVKWNIAAGRHPRYRYRGGAVDYMTGLPADSACAWLRNKRRHEAPQEPVRVPAEPATPTPGKPAYTSWPEVHRSVTASVWARIWGDLSDQTRQTIKHLDPATDRHLRSAA